MLIILLCPKKRAHFGTTVKSLTHQTGYLRKLKKSLTQKDDVESITSSLNLLHKNTCTVTNVYHRPLNILLTSAEPQYRWKREVSNSIRFIHLICTFVCHLSRLTKFHRYLQM